MALVIEYYSGEQRVCTVRSASVHIPQAIAAAREGLLHYQARYANLIDIDRDNKLVGMVHRDVLP